MNSGFICPRGLLLGLWSIFEMSELGSLISTAIYQLLIMVGVFGMIKFTPSYPSALGVVVNSLLRPPRKPPDKTKYKTWCSQRSLVSQTIVSYIAFVAIVEPASGFTQAKDSGRSFTIVPQFSSIATSSSISLSSIKLESRHHVPQPELQISDESANCYFTHLPEHSKANGACFRSLSLDAGVSLGHLFGAAEFGPFNDEVCPPSSGSSYPAELCNCIC